MSTTGDQPVQPPVPARALNLLNLSDDDLNGDCFVTGAEGEPEEEVPNNFVIFPFGCPAASDAAPNATVTIDSDMANLFMFVNVRASLTAGRSPENSVLIAYIRFLAVRNGLMSPEFTTASHNVRYNHAKALTDVETAAARNNAVHDNPAVIALTTHLTADARRKIRRTFSDLVCCVAYIFRVRGHHYRDDFKDRYTTLWARCLHEESDRLLDWQYIATDALHAIMPDVLDFYWRACVRKARCAGALAKRYDSAPAGVAGIMALKRGLDDVRMLFPGVVDNVPGSFKAFQDMTDKIEAGRWIGSVNSRFYGVERMRVNEGDVGALASVVLGVYSQLASESKLIESPSLKRLAEIAPATGGAIGLAARHATQSDEFSLLVTGATHSNFASTQQFDIYSDVYEIHVLEELQDWFNVQLEYPVVRLQKVQEDPYGLSDKYGGLVGGEMGNANCEQTGPVTTLNDGFVRTLDTGLVSVWLGFDMLALVMDFSYVSRHSTGIYLSETIQHGQFCDLYFVSRKCVFKKTGQHYLNEMNDNIENLREHESVKAKHAVY